MASRFHDLRSRCRSQSQRANACPAGLKAPQLGGLSRGASIPHLCERRRQPEVAVSQNRHPLSWSRRSRGHRHEAFPLRRRKWCPARAGDDEVDRFYARAITCDPAREDADRRLHADRRSAGSPRSELRDGSGRRPFPRDAALFLSAESVQSPSRRELGAGGALPRSPRISISGAPHHQQTR